MRRLATGMACGLLVLAVVGAIVHLTWRDTTAATALAYYALPPPVILVCLVGAGSIFAGLGHGSMAALSVLAAVAAAMVIAGRSMGSRDCGPRSGELSVATWNAGSQGRQALAGILRRLRPDVLVAVETRGLGRTQGDIDGYRVHASRRGLAILSRAPIAPGLFLEFGTRSRLASATIEGERPVRIVVVDVESEPWHARRPLIGRLAGVARDAAAEIVLGDFNTPPEAAAFAPLRERYVEAFGVAGSGWRPTWPLPAPLYVLDQIWLSGDVRVSCVTTHRLGGSDHAVVLARLQL